MTPEQWILGLLGALLVGLGKGGLPGAGNLTAGLYAVIFPARESVGVLLPILICADVVAVLVYRRHADWKQLLRLFPWAFAGILLGWATFGWFDNRQVQILIGGLLLFMAAVHALRLALTRRAGRAGRPDPIPHSLGFVAATGIVGGFATMVANAAGPVAAMYFLAIRLPKLSFVGTSAWFFFAVNLLKVPLMVQLGIIQNVSLSFSLLLAPAAVVGALLAPLTLRLINQTWFDRLIWAFVLLTGIGLLFRPDWPTVLLRHVT